MKFESITWQQVVIFALSVVGVIVAQIYAPGVSANVATFAAMALNFALGRSKEAEKYPTYSLPDLESTKPILPEEEKTKP